MARLMLRQSARLPLEIALRPYAQILFSRRVGTGLLVLLAIATVPRLALLSLVAVLIAQGAASVFGLGREAVREGGAACTAALTTLAAASTMPNLSIGL